VTVAPILEQPSAHADRDPFEFLLPYLDSAEEELAKATAALGWVNAVTRAASDALGHLGDSPEALLARADLAGDVARRVERMRQKQDRLARGGAPPSRMTADELADALGWPVQKVYRWLTEGRFPGVSQPGGKGTEYLIPADTPARLQNGQEA
jgi:hypothetical protein